MQLKVVIILNVSHFYPLLFSLSILIPIIMKFLLSFQAILNLFLYFFIFHLVFACYIIYSFFEFYVMQEKQGSKLSLSKEKILSNRGDAN